MPRPPYASVRSALCSATRSLAPLSPALARWWGSAFRWLAAHPAGRVLQRAVVAAASRIGTAASGAAVALGRARSEHELGSLLAVLSCLVFNTYLAVLSHSLPAADRPPDNEQQEQESVAAASHEQGSDSATQLLLRDW